jgi:hypothetical protein
MNKLNKTEIDLNKKHILMVPGRTSPEQVIALHKEWKQFIENNSKMFIIISDNVEIIEVK